MPDNHEQPTTAAAVTGNPPGQPPTALLTVGIGASAGGLEACTRLIGGLGEGQGAAFILVQHLDPTHESLLASLLAEHTAMVVLEATDGMRLQAAHVYVIPPGRFLALHGGALQLSRPPEGHAVRLPFDVLLASLAADCGARAVCVVLSGTGQDGSAGARAVKAAGGLVIAQDPGEAAYDGMPRSAVATGAVDQVLPVADIPAAIAQRAAPDGPPGASGGASGDAASQAGTPAPDTQDLSEIIALLRARTSHDFTLYKAGTIARRIERRMAMLHLGNGDLHRYIDALHSDPAELDRLGKDLLINVTSFFRDPKVYEFLKATIVPAMVRAQPDGQPLRIWTAGCSTGEETYSLAMLFLEEIAATCSSLRLQVFASDADADAIAAARDGIYPASIAADVSADRLARFFCKEGASYRVLPDLRSIVVFAVQDVLIDPPFSRIDLVSCRNLLIYLRPEAQTRALALFHFALREGGVLLLGSSESPGEGGHFDIISKPNRVYRHVGRSRPGDLALLIGAKAALQPSTRQANGHPRSRQTVLAELCRRMVLENFAPAAVLINQKLECLHSLGPVERYLRVPSGAPTYDLLAMTPPDLRLRLRAAVERVEQERAPVVIAGGRTRRANHHEVAFRIHVQGVPDAGEKLLLVCFVDATSDESQERTALQPDGAPVPPRVRDLEQELAATRLELQGAVSSLEHSSEEQKAINEEALSVNEEFQSTNEELLTSKEELQSLNEELTALNSQLEETLARQRTTSNDLQNVLYSTDAATLFLDPALKIRFFTPAVRAFFGIIPGDVGRPLADLHSLAVDATLLDDAAAVLRTLQPSDRDIATPAGSWYVRRVLPYRTDDDKVEGVVITFRDITQRRQTADALEAAKREAEQANATKSRFLAAASHDLRQPLQTLKLLQGLLSKTVVDDRGRKLVGRIDDTLGAMAGMLNTLLDINQIEVGNVKPEIADFPVNTLLERLQNEFSYPAQAKQLAFRVVPCGAVIRSDENILEQMLRNLISNALKYTEHGKILLGCRHRAAPGGARMLSIEVGDTGIGILEQDQAAIFEEYRQLDNAARERSRGLGLGLSIVARLGDLLGHPVRVRSKPGVGSIFSIDVPLQAAPDAADPSQESSGSENTVREPTHLSRSILIVEDDVELRDLLALSLQNDGHLVAQAHDGRAALALLESGMVRPNLVLADYNLPGLNGLQLADAIRRALHCVVPVLILTGDIATETELAIAGGGCAQLNKPVKMDRLSGVIQQLLAEAPALHPVLPADAMSAGNAPGAGPKTVLIVDDDRSVRDALSAVLEDDGREVVAFSTCDAFLESVRPGKDACLLIDAYLPGMSGLQLLRRLRDDGDHTPAIMITGNSDVTIAIEAMKAGAIDFIEKPISRPELLASVAHALELASDAGKVAEWHETAARHIRALTPRQREIMDLVLAGHPSKNIAADLGISQRTIENHRASIMKKTGATSLPALARMAVAADWNDAKVPVA